jgi:hypothetical protein
MGESMTKFELLKGSITVFHIITCFKFAGSGHLVRI